MESINFKITYAGKTSKIHIEPIPDWHLGNCNRDVEKEETVFKRILRDPNRYTIIMGDIAEGIVPHPMEKRFDYETVDESLNTPDKQYHYAYNKLRPLAEKNKIIGILTGNHDETLRKLHYYDWIRHLCDDLQVNYLGYLALINLSCRRANQRESQSYTIFAAHDGYAGERLGGHVNRVEDFASWIEADIFVAGHCLSQDTEILTENGWRKYENLHVGDKVLTVKTEKQPNFKTRPYDLKYSFLNLEYNPINKLFKYNHYNELIHLKGKMLDVLATPEHRMYYKTLNQKHFIKKQLSHVSKVKSQIKIPISGHYIGKGLAKSDDEIRLAAWLISEGHFRKYGLNIFQNWRSSYRDDIESVLNNLNIHFSVFRGKSEGKQSTFADGKTYASNDDCAHYYIWSKDAKKIKQWISEKRIPRSFQEMNTNQFLLFIQELVKGDGWVTTKRKGYNYCTNDKVLADQLQELSFKHGFYCSISKYKKGFTLYLTKRETIDIVPSKRSETKSYTGFVWCVSVNNENIIIRRNNHVAIVGNSHQLYVGKKICIAQDQNQNLYDKVKIFGVTGSFLRSYVQGQRCYIERRPRRPSRSGTITITIEPYHKRLDGHT